MKLSKSTEAANYQSQLKNFYNANIGDKEKTHNQDKEDTKPWNILFNKMIIISLESFFSDKFIDIKHNARTIYIKEIFGDCHVEYVYESRCKKTVRACKKTGVKLLMMDIYELIQNVELFKLNKIIMDFMTSFLVVDTNNLKMVHKIYTLGTLKNYKYGDFIIKEGDLIDKMFFIKTGSVEVSKISFEEDSAQVFNKSKYAKKVPIVNNVQLMILNPGTIITFENQNSFKREFTFKIVSYDALILVCSVDKIFNQGQHETYLQMLKESGKDQYDTWKGMFKEKLCLQKTNKNFEFASMQTTRLDQDFVESLKRKFYKENTLSHVENKFGTYKGHQAKKIEYFDNLRQMSDEFIAKNVREAFNKGDMICKQNLIKSLIKYDEEEPKLKLPFYKLKKNVTHVGTNQASTFSNAQNFSQFDSNITKINENIKDDNFSNMSLCNLIARLKNLKLEKDKTLNNVESENYTITLEPNEENLNFSQIASTSKIFNENVENKQQQYPKWVYACRNKIMAMNKLKIPSLEKLIPSHLYPKINSYYKNLLAKQNNHDVSYVRNYKHRENGSPDWIKTKGYNYVNRLKDIKSNINKKFTDSSHQSTDRSNNMNKASQSKKNNMRSKSDTSEKLSAKYYFRNSNQEYSELNQQSFDMQNTKYKHLKVHHTCESKLPIIKNLDALHNSSKETLLLDANQLKSYLFYKIKSENKNVNWDELPSILMEHIPTDLYNQNNIIQSKPQNELHKNNSMIQLNQNHSQDYNNLVNPNSKNSVGNVTERTVQIKEHSANKENKNLPGVKNKAVHLQDKLKHVIFHSEIKNPEDNLHLITDIKPVLRHYQKNVDRGFDLLDRKRSQEGGIKESLSYMRKVHNKSQNDTNDEKRYRSSSAIELTSNLIKENRFLNKSLDKILITDERITREEKSRIIMEKFGNNTNGKLDLNTYRKLMDSQKEDDQKSDAVTENYILQNQNNQQNTKKSNSKSPTRNVSQPIKQFNKNGEGKMNGWKQTKSTLYPKYQKQNKNNKN